MQNKVLAPAVVFLIAALCFCIFKIQSLKLENKQQQQVYLENYNRLTKEDVSADVQRALQMYCYGVNGNSQKPIPDATNWESRLRPYLTRKYLKDPFALPGTPGLPPHRLALNRRLAGKLPSSELFGRAVLFESSMPGPNAVGDEKDLPPDDGLSGLVVVMVQGEGGYIPHKSRPTVTSMLTGYSSLNSLAQSHAAH